MLLSLTVLIRRVAYSTFLTWPKSPFSFEGGGVGGDDGAEERPQPRPLTLSFRVVGQSACVDFCGKLKHYLGSLQTSKAYLTNYDQVASHDRPVLRGVGERWRCPRMYKMDHMILHSLKFKRLPLLLPIQPILPLSQLRGRTFPSGSSA